MYKKTIIKGALILSIASIITKILGFVYRIYMTKLLGAEGMGLYQLIYPLYLLCWAISASGLCTAVSKLTAQETAKSGSGNARRILYYALLIGVGLACILSVGVHHFSYELAVFLLKDSRCADSLKIISLCFAFMAAGSIIRGYFLGINNVSVSAISQIAEQLARMLTVFLLSSAFMQKSLEDACMGAVIGMAVGELVSFLYALFAFAIHSRKSALGAVDKPDRVLASMLLSMAVPLTLNRICSSLFSTAENILLPRALVSFGLEYAQALSSLGELSGMAVPLVMFPSSFLGALATATLPAVSESAALGNKKRISSALHQSVVITAIISVGTSGIFVFYPTQLSGIFHGGSTLANMLRLIAPICPFIYLQISLSGILNGLGEQLFIFLINLLSSAITIGCIFVIVPIFGINGFIGGWLASAIICCSAAIHRLKNIVGIKKSLSVSFACPTACIVAGCLTARLVFNGLPPLFQMGISGIIYLLLLLAVGYVSISDFST